MTHTPDKIPSDHDPIHRTLPKSTTAQDVWNLVSKENIEVIEHYLQTCLPMVLRDFWRAIPEKSNDIKNEAWPLLEKTMDRLDPKTMCMVCVEAIKASREKEALWLIYSKNGQQMLQFKDGGDDELWEFKSKLFYGDYRNLNRTSTINIGFAMLEQGCANQICPGLIALGELLHRYIEYAPAPDDNEAWDKTQWSAESATQDQLSYYNEDHDPYNVIILLEAGYWGEHIHLLACALIANRMDVAKVLLDWDGFGKDQEHLLTLSETGTKINDNIPIRARYFWLAIADDWAKKTQDISVPGSPKPPTWNDYELFERILKIPGIGRPDKPNNVDDISALEHLNKYYSQCGQSPIEILWKRNLLSEILNDNYAKKTVTSSTVKLKM